MKLDDLQNPSSAAVMAQLLKKHHGIQMPVDQMTARTATTMLENVQRKLTKFRNTHASHVAERNSNYLAMLMVEQTLKAKIAEDEDEDPDVAAEKRRQMYAPLKQAASKLGSAVRRAIPGQDYYSGSGLTYGDVKDRLRTAKAADKAIDQGKAYSAASRGLSSADIFSGSNLNPRTIQSALMTAQRNPQNIDPKIAAELYKVVDQLNKKGLISESVQLTESSVGEAEVVLAAKDMVDRIQDMVETMGKMVNEELPALNETIRDTMSAEQADAFTASATEAINAALENIRDTKNALDAATRSLAGEEPAAEPMGTEPMAGEPTEPMEPEAGSEDLGVAEPEPLGRGKR